MTQEYKYGRPYFWILTQLTSEIVESELSIITVQDTYIGRIHQNIRC